MVAAQLPEAEFVAFSELQRILGFQGRTNPNQQASRIHAGCKHPMQLVEPPSKHLVLARPICPILRVCAVEMDGNPAVLLRGKFLPVERIAELSLDRLALGQERLEGLLGRGAIHQEIGA